jgi:hypothetical protein
MTTLAPAFGAFGRRLMRRMTAILAGAALLLAGAIATATPARAQSNEDIIRFLLGAAAVAIIIRAIDDNHRPHYIDQWTLPDSCLERVRIQGRNADIYNARCLSRGGYRNMPQHCEVSYRTHDGRRTGYEARCLYRTGYQAQDGYTPQRPNRMRLPSECELTYRIGGDRAIGYDGLCLRHEGFTDLPRRCERTTRGGDILFDGECLWDMGYRRDRR